VFSLFLVNEEKARPIVIRMRFLSITPSVLIKALALYSACTISLIAFAILSSSQASVDEKAVIKMALGLIVGWVLIGGTLMYRFRHSITRFVRHLPAPWGLKFVLLATVLALFEEAITVTMTNLAPVFGSEVGQAFITASANYLHTVLFHSVIVFIPMFIVWAFLLRRYDFPSSHVFLLFGLTGSLAEMSLQPTSILAGFWFFVYGLMVWLPARPNAPICTVRGI